jgi:CobQ-like glutamine amidotransferase family enzyme
MTKKEINLYHFMPDKLNLYGDIGNVIAIKKRAEWKGIHVNVINVEDTNNISLDKMDLFFIGGGSDREQKIATDKLAHIKNELKDKIESGTPGLLICGGYQFLGKKYITLQKDEVEGLAIFDFHTEAKEKRLVGNIVLESKLFGPIVGFENHSGQTFHKFPTLGKVTNGYGNTEKGGYEGLHYKNIIGTYLHGPILPKNPKIADYLIDKAIQQKYGIEEKTKELINTIENRAQMYVIDRETKERGK